MHDDPLFEEARERFRNIAEHLQRQLEDLHRQGVLDRTDLLRLVEESKLSGHAVLKALDSTDYPLDMQRELVNSLIVQYETSTTDILANARLRQYSPERIEARLVEADRRVVGGWEDALRTKTVTQRQYDDMLVALRRMHSEAIDGIRSIPSGHPKRIEMTDSWIADYEARSARLATIPVPQLDYAPSRPISAEPSLPTPTSASTRSPSSDAHPSTFESAHGTQDVAKNIVRRFLKTIFRREV